MFATKPQQAAAMVASALQLGVDVHWLAGDEVFSGRELRTQYGCMVSAGSRRVFVGRDNLLARAP
jgi:hypothetical protein